MKHLEAGLIVGGIALAVMMAVLIAWTAVKAIAGEQLASILVGAVVGIIIIVTIIDWRTEK